MKKLLLLALASTAIIGNAFAQTPLSPSFSPMDTAYSNKAFSQATGINAKVLFSGVNDFVHNLNTGDSAVAKGNQDYTGYYPINGSSSHGYIIVNHEITNTKNSVLGDGGGMTVFEVKKDANGEWQVISNFNNVDFTGVGGTNVNCGGASTFHGTFMTAEEYPKENNPDLYAGGNGIQDTSDWTIPAGNGTYSGEVLKRYENYGWMVEVDPTNATALRKLYGMGRFSHEGGYAMPDNKTVYLTDDYTPGILFKFIADNEGDFRSGQLYAYKQGANGVGGSWITLPMDLPSLVNIREVAISMGATMFIRLEWVVEANGKLYITETGLDNTGSTLKDGISRGGNIANHHWTLNHNGDSTFTDYYGRVLELDLKTNTIRPYINGGNATTKPFNFTNPDGLAKVRQNGKMYLVINEDINGRTFNRVPAGISYNVCEIFYLDLSIENPTPDDLELLAHGSSGAETTGGIFTPDGTTYFVNNQHPSSSNAAPWNQSATLALTGFKIPEANQVQQWSVTPSLVKVNQTAFANVNTHGIISSDDYIENSPEFVFGGSADGAGIVRDGNGNYIYVVNHEDNFSVSRLVLDQNLKPISGEYLLNSNAGMWRLCSGTLATPEEHGFGPVYLTCGESGIESMTHAVPVFGNPKLDSLAEVPYLTGFGRWSAENAVPLPKGAFEGKTVVIIGDDDSGPDGGQLAMYVADRGDLKGGKVYVLRRKDQNQIETAIVADGSTYDVEFVEVPNHRFLTGAQINTYSNSVAKSIRFNRVEDIDYRKGNAAAGREIYFNATGNSNTYSGERTKWGRVYRLILDENNMLSGKLECIMDGDVQASTNPAIALIQPDNICVTEDYVYVQEDHNGYSTTNGQSGATEPQTFLDNKKHDGQIYQYDIQTKQVVVLMELDHRRNEVDKEKYNSDGNGNYVESRAGSWEYGAMVDLSHETGMVNSFMISLQPHTWRDDKYKAVDGGSVRLNEKQASMLIVAHNIPRVKAMAPTVNGMTVCAGESVELTATDGSTFWETNGTSYKWYSVATGGNEIGMGATFTTPALNATTTYYVSTYVSGMESTTRTAVTVTVETIPSKPTVTANGKTLTSSASTGNQWYRNGKMISGATSNTYTVTQDGFYSVVVNTSSGCMSTASDEVFVYPTSLEEVVNNGMEIFPNPNNGSFLINMNIEYSGEVMIKVLSLKGEVVYQGTESALAGNFNAKIDLAGVANGTYVVTVLAGEKMYTGKVQKR